MSKRNILRPPLRLAVFVPWQSQVLNHANQNGLHCWGIDSRPWFWKLWKWEGVRYSRSSCVRKPLLALNYLRWVLAYHLSDSLVPENTETSSLPWPICHTNCQSLLCTTDQPLAAVHASLDTMARQTSSLTLITRGCLVMVSSFSTCTWWWKEGTLSFRTKGMKYHYYFISLLFHIFILFHGKLNTTLFLCFNVGLCNALTQV